MRSAAKQILGNEVVHRAWLKVELDDLLQAARFGAKVARTPSDEPRSWADRSSDLGETIMLAAFRHRLQELARPPIEVHMHTATTPGGTIRIWYARGHVKIEAFLTCLDERAGAEQDVDPSSIRHLYWRSVPGRDSAGNPPRSFVNASRRDRALTR